MNISDFNKAKLENEDIEKVTGYSFNPSNFKKNPEYLMSVILYPMLILVFLMILGAVSKFDVPLFTYMILWIIYFGTIFYRWFRLWTKIYRTENLNYFKTYNYYKYNTQKETVDKKYSNKIHLLFKYRSAIWLKEVENKKITQEVGDIYTTYYKVEEILDGDESKIDVYLSEIFGTAYDRLFELQKKNFTSLALAIVLVILILITSGWLGIIFSVIAIFLHNKMSDGFQMAESAYDFNLSYDEFKDYMEKAMYLDELNPNSHKYEDVLDELVVPASHQMLKVYALYYAKELKQCSNKFLANEVYQYTIDNIKINYVTSDDDFESDNLASIDINEAKAIQLEDLPKDRVKGLIEITDEIEASKNEVLDISSKENNTKE